MLCICNPCQKWILFVVSFGIVDAVADVVAVAVAVVDVVAAQ